MKACVLEAISNLNYCDVPTPEPKKGEVLLKIKACGICSSDIDRVFKTGTYSFPTIPGHEFSGEIVALGEGVEKSLLHKRAAVFPLLPCFKCPSCVIGEYARCEHYNYFGSRCNGAFAEYITVPVWNLIFLPDDVSYDSAALCEPSAVALHAISKAQVYPGNTIVIIGSGTIGLLAAMWARICGVEKVVIVGRNTEKLEFVKKFGFDYVINTLQQDPVEAIKEITNGKGAEVAMEMVGSPEAINITLKLAKKGGTVILTGNPTGDITLERDTYWQILRGELTLHGTWNSSYNESKNDWLVALKYIADGKLNPEKLITHRFPLCESDLAFYTLKDKKSQAIKVIFENY
jgi:L-iditol 2-dehydrogenase